MKSSEQLQRAQKWLQDGVAARRDGDARRTRELLGKAFAVFERLSHPRGIVLATHHLGLAEYQFGRFDEAIAWLQRSIETARAVGARREEALSLGNLGLLFNDRGDLVAAEQAYEDALTIHGELDDWRGAANQIGNLGLLALARGDLDRAIERFHEALGLFMQLEDVRGAANSLNCLGDLHRKRGEIERASECFEHGLALFRDLGDKAGEALVLANLGNLQRASGRLGEAYATFVTVRDLYAGVGDQKGVAATLTNLANVDFARGAIDAAEARYREALALDESIGFVAGIAGDHGNLGNLYVSLGEYERARRHFEQAIALYQRIESPLGTAVNRCHLGQLCALQGDQSAADEQFRGAAAIADEHQLKVVIASSSAHLGGLAYVLGRLDEAVSLLVRARASYDELGNFPASANVGLLVAQIASFRGDRQLAHRELDAAHRIFETGGFRPGIADALYVASGVAFDDGDLDNAEAAAREALAHFESLRYRFGIAQVRVRLAEIAAERGLHRDALREAGEGERIWREIVVPQGRIEALGAIASALGELERLDEAEAAFDEATELLATLDYPIGAAVWLRRRAALMLRHGERAYAEELFGRALAELERLGAGPELRRTQRLRDRLLGTTA